MTDHRQVTVTLTEDTLKSALLTWEMPTCDEEAIRTALQEDDGERERLADAFDAFGTEPDQREWHPVPGYPAPSTLAGSSEGREAWNTPDKTPLCDCPADGLKRLDQHADECTFRIASERLRPSTLTDEERELVKHLLAYRLEPYTMAEVDAALAAVASGASDDDYLAALADSTEPGSDGER